MQIEGIDQGGVDDVTFEFGNVRGTTSIFVHSTIINIVDQQGHTYIVTASVSCCYQYSGEEGEGEIKVSQTRVVVNVR